MECTVVTDLGGALSGLSQYGLPKNQRASVLRSRCRYWSLSTGDYKLLGGCARQALSWVKRMDRTITSTSSQACITLRYRYFIRLEATLRLYLNPEKLTEKLPTLRLLTQPLEQLKINAMRLKERLESRLNCHFEIQFGVSYTNR